MRYLLIIPTLFLAACSTKNDVKINEHHQAAVIANEKARMEAIREIARQGEAGAVAAAMMMQQNDYSSQSSNRPPRTNGDRALDLAKTVLGDTLIGVGQIAATVYAAEIQKDIAINNSNNNAEVTMHTNDTMAGIAEVTIVDPSVVETSTTTTTTTSNTTTTNN